MGLFEPFKRDQRRLGSAGPGCGRCWSSGDIRAAEGPGRGISPAFRLLPRAPWLGGAETELRRRRPLDRRQAVTLFCGRGPARGAMDA